MISKKIPAILYGGDYNPEQWPESVWEEDILLMKKAGVNLVSICIFSWAKLNPAPGKFDFGWLDKLMDMLAEAEIFVDMATATASPPAWLGKLYPDSRPIDRDGTCFYHGSRQNYTPCSPSYRRFAAEMVDALAEHYKNHPALAMWHVNNEIGAHIKASYGPDDTKCFVSWLKKKYITIDGLNTAWGSTFWSQVYYDWDEILTPCKSPAGYNPGQELDFARFFSDMYIELFLMERDIIKKHTPDIPVTTNLMGFHRTIDQMELVKHMELISVDSYPDSDPLVKSQGSPDVYDCVRSYNDSMPWLLMEQSTSQPCWRQYNRPKAPGLMRLWSYQALARGSEGILFFQWRQSKFGGEKFHSAMVPHVDPDKSRIYKEVCQLGKELKTLAPIMGSTIKSEVGILLDWDNIWALELGGKIRKFNFEFEEWHEAFFKNNIPVNFIHPSADLSGNKIIVAPLLYLLKEDTAENLRNYVKNGGTLIVTYFSGLVDENEHIVTGGYPAYLRDVLGLWVEEWDVYPDGIKNRVVLKNGKSFECSFFAETIHTEGAEVLGVYENEFYKGTPALTRNSYGSGKAYYVATKPDKAFILEWITELLEEDGVSSVLSVPEGVEVVLRERPDGKFLFILNHNESAVEIDLNHIKGNDLVSGGRVEGNLMLSARDVAVISI